MEQAGGLDSLGLVRDSAERAVAFEATKHTSTMPSVAGMGLEFSCGEDPKLVPAVATGAEPHGAAPEEFVAIMTAALKGASQRVGAHREPLMIVRPSPLRRPRGLDRSHDASTEARFRRVRRVWVTRRSPTSTHKWMAPACFREESRQLFGGADRVELDIEIERAARR